MKHDEMTSQTETIIKHDSIEAVQGLPGALVCHLSLGARYQGLNDWPSFIVQQMHLHNSTTPGINTEPGKTIGADRLWIARVPHLRIQLLRREDRKLYRRCPLREQKTRHDDKHLLSQGRSAQLLV